MSWIERLNVVKMSILPILSIHFNEIPSKVSGSDFMNIDKFWILYYILYSKKHQHNIDRTVKRKSSPYKITLQSMWELTDPSTVEIHKTYNNKNIRRNRNTFKRKNSDTKEMKVYELSYMNLKLPSWGYLMN